MKALSTYALWALHLSILALFVCYLFIFHDSFPREDEWWLLADYTKDQTVLERFQNIFQSKNGHHFSLVFLLYELQRSFLGEINLSLSLFLGYSLLLWILYGLLLPKPQHLPYALALVSFILLTPLSHYMLFFSEHLLQYTTLFAVLIWCVHILIFQRKKKILLYILAYTCTFAFGSGLVIWPCGLLAYFLLQNSSKKEVFIWILHALVAVSLNFLVGNKHTGLETNPFAFLTHLDKYVVFVSSFPSSAMDFFPTLVFSNWVEWSFAMKLLLLARIIVIFLIPVATIGYFVKVRKFDKIAIFYICIMAFVFLSGCLAGIFRSEVGYGEALAERYRFFGAVYLASFLLLLLHTFPSYKKCVLSFSVLYFIAMWMVYLPETENRHRLYTASKLELVNISKSHYYRTYGDKIAEQIEQELIPSIQEAKYYQWPEIDSIHLNYKNSIFIKGYTKDNFVYLKEKLELESHSNILYSPKKGFFPITSIPTLSLDGQKGFKHEIRFLGLENLKEPIFLLDTRKNEAMKVELELQGIPEI